MFTALKNSPVVLSQSYSNTHVPPSKVLLMAPAAPSSVTSSSLAGPCVHVYFLALKQPTKLIPTMLHHTASRLLVYLLIYLLAYCIPGKAEIPERGLGVLSILSSF